MTTNPESIQQNERTLSTCEIKMAKTMALTVGVYVVCYSSYLLNFYFVLETDKSIIGTENYTRALRGVLIFLASLNQAINPLIYSYRVKPIRDKMKSIFGK